MPDHEPKRCPRCGNGFECRQGSIHRCQCVDVLLTDEVREAIAHTYDDCLCRACLKTLARGVEAHQASDGPARQVRSEAAPTP